MLGWRSKWEPTARRAAEMARLHAAGRGARARAFKANPIGHRSAINPFGRPVGMSPPRSEHEYKPIARHVYSIRRVGLRSSRCQSFEPAAGYLEALTLSSCLPNLMSRHAGDSPETSTPPSVRNSSVMLINPGSRHPARAGLIKMTWRGVSPVLHGQPRNATTNAPPTLSHNKETGGMFNNCP